MSTILTPTSSRHVARPESLLICPQVRRRAHIQDAGSSTGPCAQDGARTRAHTGRTSSSPCSGTGAKWCRASCTFVAGARRWRRCRERGPIPLQRRRPVLRQCAHGGGQLWSDQRQGGRVSLALLLLLFSLEGRITRFESAQLQRSHKYRDEDRDAHGLQQVMRTLCPCSFSSGTGHVMRRT